jgi:hypothetical protein
MERSGKDRLKLEVIASELAKMVLRPIEPGKLKKLEVWGVNPENSKHRLEIVILSLFSFRAAIPSTLGQEKGKTLLLYIEQLLKISYIDILKFGNTEQFETFLKERYEEYDRLDRPGATTSGIGLCFSKNIGIDHAALISWADMSHRKINLMYVDYLKMINNRYELIC